ncbi:XRE family transcriptional regulator [Glycocaulis alkaliphilus]|uniref:XRE family transcriptional regulator n=1 Tax=Glycocaulis alkaliphilus TaxID=1434191 RepID=A0A3T0E789_9PROT|nr:helix-turn-helix transcriptional regulator [Glycocaulis alkaliphilus]AZU03130.1 XRE family transcriptional regulator [Glycocaulis alkaliphilus]GGB71236.1 hypothetical protein GCM10007417_08780 [Glycocaulis alkaliphilus]
MEQMASARSTGAIDRHVGIRIRLRRRILQMSSQTLAAKLGVTLQQVERYENGASRIGAAGLFSLACTLKVPVGYFFEGFDPALKR